MSLFKNDSYPSHKIYPPKENLSSFYKIGNNLLDKSLKKISSDYTDPSPKQSTILTTNFSLNDLL